MGCIVSKPLIKIHSMYGQNEKDKYALNNRNKK